ncbi:YciI family protein [Pseudaminobacter soli (ex Li et al. 2025)]|uniref:YCII-related domain-containing protein n=1 Tax=Pseudaminobacter soli (ex Li et al. 2025) TaxID=1295366 RepID=A0A2P7SML2_9HYPH|nr:YciI family protein [Mesorhizobium soli]PSJ63693.1 hypothetical protein C7I85_00725 [Mesorhizobium soli]
MRFMIVVKASKDSEAGVMPGEELLSAMVAYHEQLAQAGILVDANGLHPSSTGWRIKWSDGRKTVVDGPFTETKELIAGYTIINVKSEEEAREWAGRFPEPHMGGGEIEIRRVFELEDFGDRPEIDRFRELEVGRK